MRRPLRCICIPFFLLLCLPSVRSAKAQESPAVAPQAIQVKVARVNVGVVVTGANGKFVEGLQREAFHVFDNGIEQPITEFTSIEESAQVLLLVEAGPAAYFLQQANLFAAGTMLQGLSAGDRIAIVRYTDAPLALLDFTTDKQVAQAALDSIQFNVGFGDLNLSSSLGTVLGWLQQVPGKKAVVLIATGVDTSPPAALIALQSSLPIGDVPVLCISTSGPLRNGKHGGKAKVQQAQTEFQAADQLLQWIAESTGGRAYFPANEKSLQDAFRDVAQIIRHEYSLAFAPPVADGALHKIDVQVGSKGRSERSDLRVDHRKGYLAPKE